MNNKLVRELSARAWARELDGCANLICDLHRGDRFRFPSSEVVCVYLGRGWYREEQRANGKTMRTGILTACHRVASTQE
jgi:hypothetical protein